MVENKEQIVVGRRSAGYALSMFRAGVKESELVSGYLMNTKKEIDDEIVYYLWKWLHKIYGDLPQRTRDAWGGQGCPRKPFFNWLYQLKHMEAFRAFAWEEMKKDRAATAPGDNDYLKDVPPVDYSGFSDLADYDPKKIKDNWESWILSGAGVPAGDNGAGAVNTPF